MRNTTWLAAALAFLSSSAFAQSSTAVRHHPLAVPGLAAPARIVVDQWGVPHIQAASERDAFFLQGWNAARDRLWQIDLWRKRGLGLLAGSFGPDYADQDRAARLFLYRGDMALEWAAYGPKAKSRAEAFVAGVDAYVGDVRAGRLPLPVEFQLTASQPDLWKPEDVVRIRSHALTRNASSEVVRAQVACAAGLAADRLRHELEPDWTTKIPDGLDPCTIPADVLNDYDLGTRDVEFGPKGAVVATGADVRLAAMTDRAAAEGSNNWVISPARSATGRPILANDPHRQLGVPSLRYIVQLKAPGLDVIGAGEPALPGVSVGHNEAVAFGLTIFAIDQEDLYVYDLNPENPHQYRYDGGWENMRMLPETIPVKGGAPVQVDLWFTRHGPVLKRDGKHAFAIRTVWAEPGTSAYFGSIAYDDAVDWAGFRADMSQWGAPSENMVFASTAGDIGWIAAGRAPIRPNWDGLMPVPGDGRYEWKGFLAADQLPSVHNPPEGWFASANEMNLPPGYPAAERKVGFEWSDPSRAIRIKQVLAANAHVSLADSMNLQMDDTSPEACRLKALLAPTSAADADAALGLSLIQAWDCREGVGSAAAAVYEEWAVKHLPEAVFGAFEPAAAPHLGGGTLHSVIAFLETPRAAPQRQRVMLASLGEAVRAVRAKLDADPAKWRWGAMHHAHFAPAVAPLADASLAAQMSVGPLEVRGSASTPAAATWSPHRYEAISGASVRLDLDVGDWDRSVAVNTPGQSGDPYSPHYRDLFPLWAGGDFFPLAFSDAAVEAAARDVYDLTPAPTDPVKAAP
ncbi:MAG TPA: penicillin acylase family protein [Caulobacteraceae bacterium]|nr:penicillin acylase family protein [Caulobacteraceae bacterium]